MFKAYIKPFISLKSNSYINKKDFFRNTKIIYLYDNITNHKNIENLKFKYNTYNFYSSMNNSFTHCKKSYMQYSSYYSFTSKAKEKYYYYTSIVFLSIKYNINF